MMSKFAQAVVKVVCSVPAGQVVSYGQVAAYVGVPRAARQVGWTMRRLEEVDLPWWRVINNAGRISIKGNWTHDATDQRRRLVAEGVEVGERFEVDIEKYRFRPGQRQLRAWGLPEVYLEMAWRKFGRGY